IAIDISGSTDGLTAVVLTVFAIELETIGAHQTGKIEYPSVAHLRSAKHHIASPHLISARIGIRSNDQISDPILIDIPCGTDGNTAVIIIIFAIEFKAIGPVETGKSEYSSTTYFQPTKHNIASTFVAPFKIIIGANEHIRISIIINISDCTHRITTVI